jgi:hypothetical protein
MSEVDQSLRDAAIALAAIRAARMRAPDQPTLGERKAFADNPAALKRIRKVWADPTIAAAVHDAFDHAKHAHKAVGAASIAVAQTFPSHIADKVEVIKLSRGVLTLGVPDSSTRYIVDRLLRSGAQSALLKRVPASVKSLKIVISAPRDESADGSRRERPVDETERDSELEE